MLFLAFLSSCINHYEIIKLITVVVRYSNSFAFEYINYFSVSLVFNLLLNYVGTVLYWHYLSPSVSFVHYLRLLIVFDCHVF